MNGKIVSGVLDSSVSKLFEHMLCTYRNKIFKIIRDLQLVSLQFVRYNTVSIGLDDVRQPFQEELNTSMSLVMSRGREVDNKYFSNSLTPPINLDTEQYYELKKQNAMQINIGNILFKDINLYNNGLYLLM